MNDKYNGKFLFKGQDVKGKWRIGQLSYIDETESKRLNWPKGYYISNEHGSRLAYAIPDEKTISIVNRDVSDGYHTINELYFHRMVLFAALVHLFQHDHCGDVWKSKKHYDGTTDDGWFIVGLDTGVGQITYHYEMKYWDLFNCPELETAPEWDGHTPEDACIRIAKLCNVPETVITDLELDYPAQTNEVDVRKQVDEAVRQAWNC